MRSSPLPALSFGYSDTFKTDSRFCSFLFAVLFSFAMPSSTDEVGIVYS